MIMTAAVLVLLLALLAPAARHAAKAEEGDLYLTPVDPAHRLPEGWLERVELVPARNSLGESFLVERETLAHFERLRAELLQGGIDIELDSAYRSVEDQQRLWEEFSVRYGRDVRRYVSPPGCSEHHTGLAVDVFLIDHGRIIRDNDDLFAAKDLFAAVHARLADHGFILGVPPGKEEVCAGLSYEPWHFRYVGREAAAEIARRGMALTEYVGAVPEPDATYTVVRTAGAPDWEKVPAFSIGHILWTGDTGVRAGGQLCHDGEYLYVHLFAAEKDIRAEYTAPLSPVHEDSCLELFFQPGNAAGYFNFEINPNGCLRVQYGLKRNDRFDLVRADGRTYFDIRAGAARDGWEVFYRIPRALIRLTDPAFQFSGQMRANAYKCGDRTGHVHYLAWHAVHAAAPDFHVPAAFGRMVFED